MKRFSRRRRGGGGRSSGPSPLDAALWLGRLGESGVLDSERWVATPHEDIPAHFAILGAADGDDGSDARVVFSPHAAGDALVAALATGAHFISSDFPADPGGGDYWFDVPFGNPSRCNPVTAPIGCTPADIE